MLFTSFHTINAKLTKSYIGYCFTATQDIYVCVCVCARARARARACGGGGGLILIFIETLHKMDYLLTPV
jgi:hypothetical protein